VDTHTRKFIHILLINNKMSFRHTSNTSTYIQIEDSPWFGVYRKSDSPGRFLKLKKRGVRVIKFYSAVGAFEFQLMQRGLSLLPGTSFTGPGTNPTIMNGDIPFVEWLNEGL
jgi:hypothetical protein